MAFPIKNFKLADLFFYKDEEPVMKISILRDIALKGDTNEQAFERGVELLEWVYETCEWIIDFNRNMSIYIDGKFYKTIPTIDFEIDYSSQNGCQKAYMFCLLITDTTDEYSKIVIITDYAVTANCYDAAIAETRKWIEHEYRHFKQLEWYIKERIQIHII
ncbi:hypothetical protein [Prevotella disiens]|uniref:Uncharacterized protein n=1 Tax=Prevotella disiens TaxID=28130 RepID=A0A3E4QJ94_9BACT|nr:hypothetical protein [Prevotella disiens]RGK97643.1 hypothetical protein DXC89_08135 [Prevotella disiens]